jgi:hypothetical protein
MGKGELPEVNRDAREKTWPLELVLMPRRGRRAGQAWASRSNKTRGMETRPHREQILQYRFNRCRFNTERRHSVRCCRESRNRAGGWHG